VQKGLLEPEEVLVLSMQFEWYRERKSITPVSKVYLRRAFFVSIRPLSKEKRGGEPYDE